MLIVELVGIGPQNFILHTWKEQHEHLCNNDFLQNNSNDDNNNYASLVYPNMDEDFGKQTIFQCLVIVFNLN